MARRFASGTDFLTVTPGGLTAVTSRAITVVAVMRGTGANPSNINSGLLGLTSFSGTDQLQWFVDATKLYASGDFGSGLSISANTWGIAALSHDTGTGAWYHSWKPMDGSWTHATSGSVSSTMGNWTTVQIAKNSVHTGSVDLAAMAVYSGFKNDAAIEGLATANMADWMAANPLAAWQFNQAAVTDLVTDLTGGGANEDMRTGSSITDDPVGWTYYTSGVITTSPHSVRSGGTWKRVWPKVRSGGTWVQLG